MACPVTVARSIHVCGGADAKPWAPRVVLTAKGVECITLDPKDSGFSRFVFGTARWKACSFLDELMLMRTESSKLAIIGDQGLFVAAPPRKGSYREKAERKMVLDKAAEAEVEMVPVELPAWEGEEVKLDAMQVMVGFSLKRKALVEVELKPETLHYIASRCRASEAQPSRKRAAVEQPSKGVYWHKSKNAFVARAPAESDLKWKVLPVPKTAVGSELEAALDSAKSEAISFAEAC